MSEKLSTLILKVDLQCSSCYKKIKKVLCKLQDREKIRTIVYDEKNNTVTISGPFDPKKLSKKLCCKACKVIKDIQIPDPKPPAPPPPPPPEPEPAPPAPAPEPEPEPAPEPAPPPPPPAPEPAPEPEPAPAPAPAPPPPAPEPEPEPQKPDPEPVKPEPAPPKPEPCWTPGSGPVCCCRPWFEMYRGGCRCCSCGWVYGPPMAYGAPWYDGPKIASYGYGGPCYDAPKTCQFICEEETSCRIM